MSETTAGESQDVVYRALLADGKIRFQKCMGCGTLRHPPRWICPECLSEEWIWSEISGQGEIEYLCWYMQSFDARFPSVPYNVAIVKLAEGPRITTNILDTLPGEPAVGDAVLSEIGVGKDGAPLLFCRLAAKQ